MSFQKGTVWQQFRAMALDTVPDGCLCRPANPPSLREWLHRGAYSVSSITPKTAVLEASIQDIGASLLGEAALLLDHAQEHSIQLRQHLASARWASPAWLGVSTYYWAYFLVLAITRLIGRTPWFMADAEANVIKGLNPAGPASFGTGPRLITCDAPTSATMREVRIRKSSQTRLHDSLWRTWFGLIRDLTKPLTDDKSNASELRAYLPQVLAANALGDAWPSDYRNLVNYVPGLAYGAAHGRTPTAVFHTLDFNIALTTDQVIGQLETHSASVSGRVDLRDQLAGATRLLISMTFLLDYVANSLFKELAERRNIDHRWISRRLRLGSAQAVGFTSTTWPISDSAA